MTFEKLLLLGVLAVFLSSCSAPFEPTVNKTKLKERSLLSSLPSLSTTMVEKRGNSLFSCGGRGPDALFRQSEEGNISISLVNTGSDQSSTGAGESSGESEMIGRTPGLLMVRELFFRACEFSKNYNLRKNEAMKLYNTTLEAATKGWLSEIQKTTITIGETLANTSADSDTSTSTSTNSDTVTGTNTTATPTGSSTE